MNPAAAGNRLAEPGDRRSPDLAADNPNRVIHRKQILVPAFFGAEEQIANADVRRADDRKLFGYPPRQPQAVARGKVHIPLPGADSQLPPAAKTRHRPRDNRGKQNRQQKKKIDYRSHVTNPALPARCRWGYRT